jgi:hypothetical protein
MSNTVAEKEFNGDIRRGIAKINDGERLRSNPVNQQFAEQSSKFLGHTIKKYPYYIPQLASWPSGAEWRSGPSQISRQGLSLSFGNTGVQIQLV